LLPLVTIDRSAAAVTDDEVVWNRTLGHSDRRSPTRPSGQAGTIRRGARDFGGESPNTLLAPRWRAAGYGGYGPNSGSSSSTCMPAKRIVRS